MIVQFDKLPQTLSHPKVVSRKTKLDSSNRSECIPEDPRLLAIPDCLANPVYLLPEKDGKASH